MRRMTPMLRFEKIAFSSCRAKATRHMMDPIQSID